MQNQEHKAASRPAEIRTEGEVIEFFNQRLIEKMDETENNWYLPFVIEDVSRRLFSRFGIYLSQEPTEYSKFFWESGKAVLEEIYAAESANLSGIEIALIRCSATYGIAQPFYTSFENEVFPEQTINLVENIYTWLFTSLGRSSQYSSIRLLDKGNGSELKLWLVTKDNHEIGHENLRSLLNKTFISLYNFSPSFSIEIVRLDEVGFFELISGPCIFGDEFQSKILAKSFVQYQSQKFYSRYVQHIDQVVQELYHSQEISGIKDNIERSNSIFRNYLRVKTNKDQLILIDRPTQQDNDQDTWRGINRNFFQKLTENEFDILVVEDATKQLGDKKGQDKANQYTVLRVIGLRSGEEFVPAERIILKLRGLSWYRGDLNNLLDLIKEYSSYNFIHQNVSNPAQFFMGSGPLILSCEKLNLPFGKSETGKWIGIFLEEITPLDGQIVFTCRVRRISDFWSLDASRKRVMREAKEHNIDLNNAQLMHRLMTLSRWMWTENLSIDYCDLMFMLDNDGNISDMKLIDLERLSFGELVNEKHIFLDAIVDIKSYLLPEHWFFVLENIYRSEMATGDHIHLEEVKSYQRIPSRKRVMVINTLHKLHGLSMGFGQSLGRQIWSNFIRSLVSVFSLRYRSLRNQN